MPLILVKNLVIIIHKVQNVEVILFLVVALHK